MPTLSNILAALALLAALAGATTAQAADRAPRKQPAPKVNCIHIGSLTICTVN